MSTLAPEANRPAAEAWKLGDIDLDRIDSNTVRNDETLFYLLACASFLESGSDLYTRNLVDYYGDDPEVSGWLDERWEPEELQHGRALRAYIEHVWPEFDWETAFHAFFSEYSKVCTVDAFEPNRGLEMAARCVIETGTATLYGSLNAYTDEPVLKQLTALIRADEVRHYKYFYRYFRRYNETEHNRRSAIFGALVRRLVEIRNDDADIAIRHVRAMRTQGSTDTGPSAAEINRRSRTVLRKNLPVDMTVKMFLKPLAIPPWLNRGISYPITKILRGFVLR